MGAACSRLSHGGALRAGFVWGSGDLSNMRAASVSGKCPTPNRNLCGVQAHAMLPDTWCFHFSSSACSGCCGAPHARNHCRQSQESHMIAIANARLHGPLSRPKPTGAKNESGSQAVRGLINRAMRQAGCTPDACSRLRRPSEVRATIGPPSTEERRVRLNSGGGSRTRGSRNSVLARLMTQTLLPESQMPATDSGSDCPLS